METLKDGTPVPVGTTEKEILEFYTLLKEEKPELTKKELHGMIVAAAKYAKNLLKGKAAELYGLSLDFAIKVLKDPKADMKTRKDIVLKVLGHCLPTEVHLAGTEETGEKIMFIMKRPEQNEDGEDETNIRSTRETESISSIPR